MTRIRLHEHPFSGAPAQEFEAESAAHWLLTRYPQGPGVTLQMYRGEPCRASEITGDVDALCDPALDLCTILQSPGLEAIGFALYYLETYWYVAAAYAANAIYAASQSAGTPGSLNRTSASPNNALAGRDNQVRLRQRVEDIYGTVLSIPSVIAPPYQKRINNRRVEFGLYSVGRGYYQVSRLRDADILLSDIPGSSAAVYAPFTSPNSGHAPQLQIGDPIIDGVPNVVASKQVDGITLKAANQVQLAASGEYQFLARGGGDVIRQTAGAPNFSAVAAVGDQVEILLDPVGIVLGDGVDIAFEISAATNTLSVSGAGGVFDPIQVGEAVTVSGFFAAGNNGTFTVLAKPTPDSLQLSGTGRIDEGPIAAPRVAYTRSWGGTYELAEVSDGEVVLTTATWVTDSPPITTSVQLVGKDHVTPWYTIPTQDRTEVWVTVVALQGMFRDKGGKSRSSVDFTIEIEQLAAGTLAPTGVVETVTGTMTGQSSDELGQTIEHVTAWTGPCRVRMYRSTAYDYAFDGAIVDEIKWDNLSGVSPVDREHFGPLTLIQTVTVGTVRATSLQSRQLNCLAARLLPTYDGTTFSGVIDAEGRHVSGTLHPTSRMVDLLAAVFQDKLIGKRDLSELDLGQVWATQQELDAWHPEMGQFNYTFDTDNFTFENTVDAIARAAFCRAYRQADRTRVQFERVQATSAALFTHRNKEPRAETLTRSFANDSDNDGIEFVYFDPDTEKPETIRLPLDGSALKPRKVEMAGIRSFAQAWRHAWRAYNKLLGQRLAIETSCTIDARLLLPSQRIDIVDNTRYKSNDGEVVGQDGLVLRLSQPVHFQPGLPHSIVLMRRDGSCQGIPCTPGADACTVVLQSLPSEPIVTEYGAEGIRTIYSFAADDDRGKVAFLVDEIDPPKGRYVTVRAVNYSDSYYAADNEPIPDRASVIN